MSEAKLREALELADAALSGANMNMNVVKKKVKEALAQPADAGLTVDEAYLLEALKLLLDQVEHGDDEVWVLNKVRAVIRRCEAKKAGGDV